jgi:hypothetical protein
MTDGSDKAQIDLSSLPKSIYFIKITTDRKSYLKRVITGK